jgi:hypothetical protein
MGSFGGFTARVVRLLARNGLPAQPVPHGVGASGQQVFCEKTPMVRNDMPRADGREG